uniref:N-acetyltransferase domain-containing protein n=1 Tax=Gadus morhua TaxID=8049 RepID=A0A8C4ZBB8_GADMO
MRACFSIRGYEASDRREVLALLSDGVLEHVYPAFFRSLAYPDHVGVALSVCVAGYVLGGSSYLLALLFGAAWAGLLYYCCHQVHQGYLQRRLEAARGQNGLLEGSGLWVAETEVGGRTRLVGAVAVRAVKGDQGLYGELPLMVVSYGCRRRGLGSLLALKALETCKGHGYTRLLVDSSSPQAAANTLYRKMGFVQTAAHGETHANLMSPTQLLFFYAKKFKKKGQKCI